MVYLLDVNVLLALAWPNHSNHGRAHDWLTAHDRDGIATCPLTQCGFVRISINPKITVFGISPPDALDALRQWIARPGHVFWPDDIMFPDSAFVPHDRLAGHLQVTDAYLIGLTIRNGGRLATFDQRLATLLPPTLRSLVELVPV